MTTIAWRRLRATALVLAGALGAGWAAGAPARADEVSADAAQQLEQQVHDWLGALVGPTVPFGDRPLEVTAEADHYRLEVPLTPLASLGLTVDGPPASAKLTPLDGGRWALDDFRAPSPLHLSFTVPGDGKPGDAGTTKFTASIDHQEQHAVIDPSLTTPSHWDSRVKGYTSSTEGSKEMGSSTMQMDEASIHVAVEPGPDGRLTIVQQTDSHLVATNSVLPDGGLASFSVERMQGSIRLEGVAPEQVAPIVHAVMTLAPAGVAAAEAAKAKPDPKAIKALVEQNRAAMEEDKRATEADKQAVAEGRMTPQERKKNADERRAHAQARMKAIQAARTPPAAPGLSAEQLTVAHDALVALANLIGGFEEHGSLENMRVVAAGHSGHLGKFASGLSVGAPDGRMLIRFNLALDGLDSPDIPAGIYRDYMPRHIAIAPRIGGLPAADVRALLLRAADSQGKDPQLMDDAQALLAKGPAAVGIDELSLDFGPATLKGSGEVRISGMADYEGEAHFSATGLDELIQQANTVPELKEAGPVLFLVKGMGRQDGVNTVWDITYRQGKMLVNGNDLSGMIPGGK